MFFYILRAYVLPLFSPYVLDEDFCFFDNNIRVFYNFIGPMSI